MPTFAGYNCRVTINGANLRAHSVTINMKAEMYDATHFDQSTDIVANTDGVGLYVGGVLDADITLDAHWFTEDNPYTTFSITPRTQLNNIVIFLERVNSPISVFTFSRVLVESVDHMQAVRDSIHFTARLKNSGLIWAYPTV